MSNYLGFDYLTPLTVASNQPEVATDTLSLRRIVSSTDAQRWEAQIPLEPDSGGVNNLINTIQVDREIKGGHTAFPLLIPQPLGTDTTSTANITVSGAHSAGDTTVDIDSTAIFSIPAGRFITFGTSGKVYRVTQNAVYSSANVTNGDTITLNIFPALVTDVTDNIVVTHDDVNMQVRYDNNNGGLISYTLNEGVVNRLTISVIEAL